MPDPFELVYPMPPSFVIVSGVESGDQVAHRDTSTPPPPPPPRPTGQSRAPTFPPLWPTPPNTTCPFKQERPWGRPRWRCGTRASLTKGRFSSWSAPPATMVFHPPPFKTCKGPCSWSGPPDKKHVNVLPNTTHLDAPPDPLLQKFSGTLEQQEVLTLANSFLCGGGGWRPIRRWPSRTSGMVLSTPSPNPRVKQAPPCAPTNPPSSPARRRVSTPCRSMAGMLSSGGGGGGYQLALAKDERTDSEAPV